MIMQDEKVKEPKYHAPANVNEYSPPEEELVKKTVDVQDEDMDISEAPPEGGCSWQGSHPS